MIQIGGLTDSEFLLPGKRKFLFDVLRWDSTKENYLKQSSTPHKLEQAHGVHRFPSKDATRTNAVLMARPNSLHVRSMEIAQEQSRTVKNSQEQSRTILFSSEQPKRYGSLLSLTKRVACRSMNFAARTIWQSGLSAIGAASFAKGGIQGHHKRQSLKFLSRSASHRFLIWPRVGGGFVFMLALSPMTKIFACKEPTDRHAQRLGWSVRNHSRRHGTRSLVRPSFLHESPSLLGKNFLVRAVRILDAVQLQKIGGRQFSIFLNTVKSRLAITAQKELVGQSLLGESKLSRTLSWSTRTLSFFPGRTDRKSGPYGPPLSGSM